ncbi:MAG TPA: hypothetical protein VHM26_12875 [Chitinophagaceae bacterium]|jgi:hypothetical protein|nr:hypothetical protein [Chitinophagaceae bacterium]
MKRITTVIFLLINILASAQDKKKFFDHIEVMLNLHAGESSMEKDGWGKLAETSNPAYTIDTFYAGSPSFTLNPRRGVPDIFSSASVGVRLSKIVLAGNEKNKVPERLEWRLALMAGTVSRTRASYSNYDYQQPLPSGEFRYRQVDLTYRRHCVDLNSHLVYKFNAPLFKQDKLLFFVGMGAGATANIDGHIRENLFTYRATPSTFGYTITEENNMSRFEKVKTRIDPYFTMVMGGELRCTERFSILFEFTTTTQKQTYSSGGYLSTVFRFKI